MNHTTVDELPDRQFDTPWKYGLVFALANMLIAASVSDRTDGARCRFNDAGSDMGHDVASHMPE
jgi:hypothetical protein